MQIDHPAALIIIIRRRSLGRAGGGNHKDNIVDSKRRKNALKSEDELRASAWNFFYLRFNSPSPPTPLLYAICCNVICTKQSEIRYVIANASWTRRGTFPDKRTRATDPGRVIPDGFVRFNWFRLIFHDEFFSVGPAFGVSRLHSLLSRYPRLRVAADNNNIIV